MRLFVRLSLVWLALLATGCGGDVSSTAGVLTRAVNVSVEWGPITRLVAPPQSESAVLTFIGANADGSDFNWTIQRDLTNTQAMTEAYTTPPVLRIGTFLFSGVFYSTPTPSGTPIGTVDGSVTISPNGIVTITISTIGPVTAVNIFPGQSFSLGSSVDPLFATTGAGGIYVVVPPQGQPGGPVWNVVTGSDKVTVTNDQLIGLASGSAQVTCAIGSVLSPTQTIQITSNIGVTISPQTATASVLGTVSFTAAVANGKNGVTWSVAEGSAGGSITSGGLYTAPAQPGVYHVVATSKDDPSQHAVATVTAQAGSTGVTIQ